MLLAYQFEAVARQADPARIQALRDAGLVVEVLPLVVLVLMLPVIATVLPAMLIEPPLLVEIEPSTLTACATAVT